MQSSTFRLLFLFLVFIGQHAASQQVSLEGDWRFRIDRDDRGVTEKWYSQPLPELIKLPGSMAENGKGDEVTLQTKWTGSIYDSSFYFNPRLAKYREPGNVHFPFWLTPAKHYVGVAWYQKDVSIPSDWKDKQVRLFLERAHIETSVWVDDVKVGLQNSLVAPHEYDLTTHLSPGTHRITLRIDNRIKDINVGPDSHSITDHTQGNWNGIIGKMLLQADSRVFFDDVQVYPDLKNRKAKVVMQLRNSTSKNVSGAISISAKSFNSSVEEDATKEVTTSFKVNAGDSSTVAVDLPFGEGMLTWDEFHPNLYRLSVTLQAKKLESRKEVEFGMREFTIEGNKFLINGRPVFLRGTVHNCEFPLTGYPAMDVNAWERILLKAKAYGLNHMRFHSWCPPEAAFVAADKVGFYLQPEGPSWPNHGPKIGLGQPIDQFLYDETNRITKHYGNYASFTMLSGGNEPAGKQVEYLTAFIEYWKKKGDPRRVYTGMSVGGSWPVIPNAEYQVRGGVRGLTWNKRPETVSDFSEGIAKFSVPFVAHEMGQWCAFPDFTEIQKYTGVYRAKNFELFRQDLQDRGMGDQARDFLMASGKLQVLCYKNEIEKALRTPGYAGFQLLGLQDFPGQGTALVGVLNAFFGEKGYVDEQQFSRFCNSTVPLARIAKFVFLNQETFEADIHLAHFGPRPLSAVIKWKIENEKNDKLADGAFNEQTIEHGTGIPVGKISQPLTALTIPSKMTLTVWIEGTSFKNDWNFWVYPPAKDVTEDIYYTTSLDEKAKAVLDRGGKVFLNASGNVVKGKDVMMHFLPVFWNTSWFKMRPPHVTGILVQDKSLAFAEFPTDFHSDLQWWDIVNRSQVMVLEDFPAGFRPLVQPIDTWFINRRLALIYEARMGKGKIMVSSADLRSDLQDAPAAKQLYVSLMKYMASDRFNPSQEVSFDTAKDIFLTPSKERINMYTRESPDELKPNSGQNKK